MKIKVIDLLNKISNDEELPKKVLINDKVYYLLKNEERCFYSLNHDTSDWSRDLDHTIDICCCLNDEVVILDEVQGGSMEEKPKKIEILSETKQQCSIANNYSKDNIQCIVNEFYRKINVLVNKNNELTKAVNYLLEKSDDNV